MQMKSIRQIDVTSEPTHSSLVLVSLHLYFKMCKIVMLASSREINFNDVLAFELPASMSNADGKMNAATSKSTLKTQTTIK